MAPVGCVPALVRLPLEPVHSGSRPEGGELHGTGIEPALGRVGAVFDRDDPAPIGLNLAAVRFDRTPSRFDPVAIRFDREASRFDFKAVLIDRSLNRFDPEPSRFDSAMSRVDAARSRFD
jgi:hypothetical protein